MSDDYDSPWKETLDVYFEAFLALLFPVRLQLIELQKLPLTKTMDGQ
jgi:hypothetical protein